MIAAKRLKIVTTYCDYVSLCYFISTFIQQVYSYFVDLAIFMPDFKRIAYDLELGINKAENIFEMKFISRPLQCRNLNEPQTSILHLKKRRRRRRKKQINRESQKESERENKKERERE